MSRPKLGILDDPLAPAPAPAPPLASEPAKPKPRPKAKAKPPAPEGALDPYEGSPKVALNMRATLALKQRLDELVAELKPDFKTSTTELTEALWHFHMPDDAAAARELARRYRMVRLGE